MEWEGVDKWHIKSGPYVICKTGHPQPIYSASYKKEFLLHRTTDKNEAYRICEEHRRQHEKET